MFLSGHLGSLVQAARDDGRLRNDDELSSWVQLFVGAGQVVGPLVAELDRLDPRRPSGQVRASAALPAPTFLTPTSSGDPVTRSYVPMVRRVAAELGVDLTTLTGTGAGQRVTVLDVRAAAAREPQVVTDADGSTNEFDYLFATPVPPEVRAGAGEFDNLFPAWQTTED